MKNGLISIDFTGTDPERPHPTLSKAQIEHRPDVEWAIKNTGLKPLTKEEFNQRRENRRLIRPGRKPLHYSKRKRPVTVSLSPIERRELKTIGDGSLTGGIRYLLLAYRNRDLIDLPRPPKRPKHKIDPPKSHLTKINPHTNKPWVNPDEEDFHS